MKSTFPSVNFAVVIPMANESADFKAFTHQLKKVLEHLGCGQIYFVVDQASKDNTLQLCNELSGKDLRFKTIWAPENKNVVDAYIRGFREAYQHGHDYIIEMDAGLSHDPQALPDFISKLVQTHECVFGSRNICGGSNTHSPLSRRFLSAGGTLLANIFLGTKLKDMTSGFQGFRRHVIEKLIHYPLKSTAHFYQTEVRYLLRNYDYVEIPINYSNPSPRAKLKYILNALSVLSFYTIQRFTFRSIQL